MGFPTRAPAQHLRHDADVLDLGHVLEPAPLAGEGRRGEQLQGRVLGPLTCTVPRRELPPSMRNASGGGTSGVNSQWNGFASAID
jgi:hypothetical protein